jgi:phosphopantothenoylcysteine decarboxylase / phosphopantothenate---cysteine ligase
VGFAAETGNLVAEAGRKLQEKNLDLIVANDVSQPDSGFAVDTNEVILLSREEAPQKLPLLTKEEVAERILDWVALKLDGKKKGSVFV